MIIGFFKDWIIAVVTTVMFVILIDMILPDNSFRKYAKFVTGLIVIITILTPVFKLFDRNSSIETYINQYASTYSDNTKTVDKDKFQRDFQSQTIAAFKENLKNTIEQKIKTDTGKKITVVKLDINEDVNDMNFADIKYLELKKSYEDGQIKPVEKVVIGQKASQGEAYKDQEVLSLLRKEFNINPEKVKLVR